LKLSKILSDIDILHKRFLEITSDRGHPAKPAAGWMPVDSEGGSTDPDIESVHYNSRNVQQESLFIAVAGHQADGHAFIPEAIGRGAKALVVEKRIEPESVINDRFDLAIAGNGKTVGTRIPVIEVANSRKALSAVSARFFGKPSEGLFVIGITGTNGKTTITYLIEGILREAGIKCGVIGTINYRYAGKIYNNPVTTPESRDLQKILKEMRDNGVTHVIMEVSSHAIDLNRVDHCYFDIAVFTNLTQDHLDYHGSMADYWECKKRLFTELITAGPKKDQAIAVINCNDEKGRELLKSLSCKYVTCGHANENDIKGEDIKQHLSGISGRISVLTGSFDLNTPLTGAHNLENIFCGVGVGAALSIPLPAIKSGIESVSRIPGRLERIPADDQKYIYVDYAHTPDALKNVLSALRALADESSRMICIFGCGGDRDKAKRPLMGETAGNLCDLTIVTSDNPRTEEPMGIIKEILSGIEKLKIRGYGTADLADGLKDKGYTVQPDRKKAIQLGIAVAGAGDTVLIAGKGHEDYQIIGTRTIPFDDRQEVINALAH
jgi:UDP-N-acetylmuramyl-tripeptide synthetase